jgi:PhnB protein
MNMTSTKDTRVVQAYLFFNGRCDEALEFYQKALDAKIEFVTRFKESPEPIKPGMIPSGFENKIMHATFRIGETALMASDGRCAEKANFEGFALTVGVQTEAEADRVFNALADGGKVQMPLTKTFYSPRFGMVADRFGMLWMVIVETEKKVQ